MSESSSEVSYWCHQCNKTVGVETLAFETDVVCYECKSGFVEVSHAAVAGESDHHTAAIGDLSDDPHLASQFLQVLRLFAQSGMDDDDDDEAPPPPPPRNASSSDNEDFLRIEIDGWDEDEGEEEDEDDGEGGDNEESRLRNHRRDLLRHRFRDLVTRRPSGRNRLIDWADILIDLDHNSNDFHGFVGNPEDYVDANSYEALLQTLAERDGGGGRRGAPPAAKSAVEALQAAEVTAEEGELVCAVCKDVVGVGEVAKKLPCGHRYHGDCIVPWLGARNSCPVCRFELPTDDPEYEACRGNSSSSV